MQWYVENTVLSGQKCFKWGRYLAAHAFTCFFRTCNNLTVSLLTTFASDALKTHKNSFCDALSGDMLKNKFKVVGTPRSPSPTNVDDASGNISSTIKLQLKTRMVCHWSGRKGSDKILKHINARLDRMELQKTKCWRRFKRWKNKYWSRTTGLAAWKKLFPPWKMKTMHSDLRLTIWKGSRATIILKMLAYQRKKKGVNQ